MAAPARGALARQRHCPPENKRKNKKLVRLPQIKGTGCSDGAVTQRPKKRAGRWLDWFDHFPFYQSP